MSREQARDRAMQKALAAAILDGRQDIDYQYAIDEFEKLWPIEKETEQ